MFTFSRKYEWTKNGDATVLNSATDVSKLTIAKVLYDNDKDNNGFFNFVFAYFFRLWGGAHPSSNKLATAGLHCGCVGLFLLT